MFRNFQENWLDRELPPETSLGDAIRNGVVSPFRGPGPGGAGEEDSSTCHHRIQLPSHPALTYSGWAPTARHRGDNPRWERSELAFGVPAGLLMFAPPLRRAHAALDHRIELNAQFPPAVVTLPGPLEYRKVQLMTRLLLGLSVAVCGRAMSEILESVKTFPVYVQSFTNAALRRLNGLDRSIEKSLLDLQALRGVTWKVPARWPRKTLGETASELGPVTIAIPGILEIARSTSMVEVQWDSAVLLTVWAALQRPGSYWPPMTLQEAQSVLVDWDSSSSTLLQREGLLKAISGHNWEALARLIKSQTTVLGALDLATDIFGAEPDSNLQKSIRCALDRKARRNDSSTDGESTIC